MGEQTNAHLNAWIEANYERTHAELVEHRGGCTCFISPPCNACCEPMTEDEAEYLGYEPPEPIDYLGAARDVVKQALKRSA